MALDGTSKLRSFCLKNPTYLKVLEILEKADSNVWIKVGDVKKEAGIDTGCKGDGYASWLMFTWIVNNRWGCGYVESTHGIEGWKTHNVPYIRAVPERKDDIKRFLEKVEA